jgi:hypothetical protein
MEEDKHLPAHPVLNILLSLVRNQIMDTNRMERSSSTNHLAHHRLPPSLSKLRQFSHQTSRLCYPADR